MRAGNLDVFVETGALWTRDVTVLSPGTPVEAQAVTPGQYVFVDSTPMLVYSVSLPSSSGKVTITFGRGLYSDIRLTVDATAMVIPAIKTVIVEAEASWRYEPITDPQINPLGSGQKMPIPIVIASDGLSMTLTLDADTTAGYAGIAGAYSWDCYVRTAEWDWQRILEGTFTVTKGDTR